MICLLDTHALVWLWRKPLLLSNAACAAISNAENVLTVSAASAYEIEFKRERDPDLRPLPTDLEAAAESEGLEWLPLNVADCAEAGKLPRLHGDPWDRLIVAQARNRGMSIITIDRAIAAYPVSVLW